MKHADSLQRQAVSHENAGTSMVPENLEDLLFAIFCHAFIKRPGLGGQAAGYTRSIEDSRPGSLFFEIACENCVR